MLRLLGAMGLEPDVVGGHSFGELVALHAAGVFDSGDLAALSAARGRLMIDAGQGASGAMAAVLAGPEEVERLVREVPGVQVANWNGPRQTVVAGPVEAVDRLLELAAERDLNARRLAVSSAFHTPMVAGAREPFARVARERLRQPPARPLYSNVDAAPYPAEPPAIAARLGEHLASPVRFADMVEAMYRDGARVFIEVGPGAILTPMVESILEDQPHLAVSCDAPPTPGLPTLLRRLARLVVAGLPLRLERLTAGRAGRRLDLEHLPPGELPEMPTASTWLVNGSRARPFTAPEPTRLGTGPVLTAPARESPASARSRVDANAIGDGHINGKPKPPMTTKPPVPTAVPAPAACSQAQADPVLESFQQTMQAFLEVQKATMLAYLSGRGARPALASTSAPANGVMPLLPPAPDLAAVPPGDRESQRNGHATAPLESRLQGESPLEDRLKPRFRSNSGHEHSNGNGHAATSWRDGSRIPVPPTSPRPSDAEEPRRDQAPRDVSAPDRATITARLLEIVRDRTGYPLETLGVQLDIEADLGIDSIKRVEILGMLRDKFPAVKERSESTDAMDALARARTLGAIVDRMVALAGTAGEECTVPTGPSGVRSSGVERRVLEAVEAPLPRERRGLRAGGRVVVTDDGRGVAAELASRLEAEGLAVDRVGGPDEPVDWTSPSAIDAATREIRSRGPIAGIVHALPLGQPMSDGPECDRWTDRIGDAVTGLFLLAKSTAADLESAAHAGGSCLIAAMALGGRIASGPDPSSARFFPGHGGIAGLVKTLAREWPTVRCRTVDLSPGNPPGALAGLLADEVFAVDGWAEVGHDRGRRIRLRSVERPLMRGAPAFELTPGEPVIITGGARGITGLVAAELAMTWRPTLLIVGTTPDPTEPESPDTVGLAVEGEIKAALHARLRREGRPSAPTDIEAAYQALRRAREVRDNLEILRRAGARVEYACADVRDPSALAAALGGWRERYGEPAGLIHGAGLIKDKLIREKTPESFDRVFGTKVQGALNLIGLVRPEALKFTALFSSIAGRFGNVGQSDYAAANDVLNKLGHWLDRRWPGRVVSVIWGPWSGIGMVSQLEGHLGRQGLGMIAPDVGRTLLLDELRFGRKGDVEVIYTGGLGTLEDPLPMALSGALAEAVR
jgi:NAD(P)-dependent dehydrogenase (short-subunit alcohol dehydrogenase family)